MLVGVLHGLGDLLEELRRVPRRQRAEVRPLVQALAVDEGHREVVLAVVLADLVDRHDVGMVEVGRRLGFAVEPLHVLVRGELPGEDHLQGDRPVQLDLPGLVDHAHAAAGDLALDFVVAELEQRRGAGRRLVPRRRTGRLGRGGLAIGLGNRANRRGAGGRCLRHRAAGARLLRQHLLHNVRILGELLAVVADRERLARLALQLHFQPHQPGEQIAAKISAGAWLRNPESAAACRRSIRAAKCEASPSSAEFGAGVPCASVGSFSIRLVPKRCRCALQP